MADSESVKKMLRSVLQCNKDGVSINSLQSEYRSLCGESIPLKKLGYSKLEDYLKSIPSVVQFEHRMGELKCVAAVCQETAHIAELVARQKSSKKSGHSHVVNCRMRFKPSNPYMLNVRPRSSLRQPSAGASSKWPTNHSRVHGSHIGSSASGDYRQMDQRLSSSTPVEHRPPAAHPAGEQRVTAGRKEKSLGNCQKSREKSPEQVFKPNKSQSSLYDVELVQSRITQLLEKYYSGLWMSKISDVYSVMFGQKLHPQVLADLDKWTDICMVEKSSCNNRADQLIYPPMPRAPSTVLRHITNDSPSASLINSNTGTGQLSPKNLSTKPTFIFSPQPVAVSGKQLFSCSNLTVSAGGDCKDNQNLTSGTQDQNAKLLPPTMSSPVNAPAVASSLQTDVLSLLKVTFPPASDSTPPSAIGVTEEVRQRLKELLTKFSHGLWANALPKLFMDTYKMQFPEHILDNLSLLMDICSVEYPNPNDKKKAILYNSSTVDIETADSQESQQGRSHPFPSGLEVLSPVIPPCLVLPSEQYPSVLVTDAKSSNAVTVRYVGENYSNAQEAMEDAMRSFYSQSSSHRPLSNPVVGQLVAVRGEDEDELVRAQLIEVMAPDKVKVYYADYGFSVETSGSNLLELHQDFLCLPFQATTVRLAGLETVSSHPLILSSLDKLAVGKILLMETVQPCEQAEIPVAVLYDTSQDDDVNINSSCLKTLQDKTMNNPLTVNVTYQGVCVTNVCADGIIHCQLPSRGTAKLSHLLEQTEAFFISQMTSESLVSRPFCGKFCVSRYKGNWARVEITNMYSNSVIEILFIDLGIPATVAVTDLREIPPPLLKNFIMIPPQAIKCHLANLEVPEGDWSPEAILWMKKAVLDAGDCKIKILKLDQHKGDLLVHVYLFIGTDSQEVDKSINHQLAHSEVWQKLTTQKNNTITRSNSNMETGFSPLVEKLKLSSSVMKPVLKLSPQLGAGDSKTSEQPLPMPPLLELPMAGQNIDVFVPVACHPGYFVLQPWQDLHKLMVLTGEMILYYNEMWKTSSAIHIEKGGVYAARVDKNWHRVQVKGILANGLVSVYVLDHGKHELVRNNLIRPLIEEFRQLPFQAISAQLAGVSHHQWSEETSMLFRNHVEKRALVAQVESVQELSEVKGELWERRLTVYLVDTTLEDKDLWIHSIMADIGGELSSAA